MTVLSYKENYSNELKSFKSKYGDGATELNFIEKQNDVYSKIGKSADDRIPHEERAIYTFHDTDCKPVEGLIRQFHRW